MFFKYLIFALFLTNRFETSKLFLFKTNHKSIFLFEENKFHLCFNYYIKHNISHIFKIKGMSNEHFLVSLSNYN